MKKKILVIPIEIQSRELEGALLLAHEAIEREWIILIGQKQKIFPILSNIKNYLYLLLLKPQHQAMTKNYYFF